LDSLRALLEAEFPMHQRLIDTLTLLRELWKGFTDPAHVLFASEGGNRYFARCTSCGRVFMHYWGCVTAADRQKGRQVGCKCGGVKMRVCILPTWQQAWFLLSRYVWRKIVKQETYWDCRILEKTHAR
jgi:hypothetical protein